MPAHPTLVAVVGAAFTTVSCFAWLSALMFALKQKSRPAVILNLLVLTVATLFWWSSELLAIRIGKYQYTTALWQLPFGGSPDHQDLAYRLVATLFQFAGRDIAAEGCPSQATWNIPLAVVALEGAVVFGLFRLAVRVFGERDRAIASNTDTTPRSGWAHAAAALPIGALMALLAVNLDAILDPVVSMSERCGGVGTVSSYRGLDIGIWKWFTSAEHPGLWFGVPLVNYVGWFLLVFIVGWYMRLNYRGPERFIQRLCGQGWWKYVPVALVRLMGIVALLLLIEISLKMLLDFVFEDGHRRIGQLLHIGLGTWQFGFVILLLGVALAVVVRSRVHRSVTFDPVSVVPQIAVFFICLLALVFEFVTIGLTRPLMFVFLVWLVTAAIAFRVTAWSIVREWNRPREDQARLHV